MECPSGKQRYDSQGAATKAQRWMRKVKHREVSVYPCREAGCFGYHLTHKHKRVIHRY